MFPGVVDTSVRDDGCGYPALVVMVVVVICGDGGGWHAHLGCMILPHFMNLAFL